MFAAEEKNFRAAIAVKPTRLASIFFAGRVKNSAGMRWTPLDTHCQSKVPLTDCKHSKSVPLIRHFEQSLSSLANPCFALAGLVLTFGILAVWALPRSSRIQFAWCPIHCNWRVISPTPLFSLLPLPHAPERSFLMPARDPVCGMTVDPARAAASADFGGTLYYFCCAKCAEKFRSDPEKYLTAKYRSCAVRPFLRSSRNSEASSPLRPGW